MIIDCISDLHGFYPELDGGDLLIVAGDLTATDQEIEYFKFWQWAADQRYKKIVIVPGNHDGFLETNGDPLTNPGIFSYLCDSGTEFEGLKIWGSPWTPTFCNWHFMKDRGEAIKEKWDLIPPDTDILITHGPPYGILDECYDYDTGQIKHAGCEELRKKVSDMDDGRNRLHVFGHIHEGYGVINQSNPFFDKCTWKFVNASHVDKNYKPVNKPIRIVL